jgi:hypothetical protein
MIGKRLFIQLFSNTGMKFVTGISEALFLLIYFRFFANYMSSSPPSIYAKTHIVSDTLSVSNQCKQPRRTFILDLLNIKPHVDFCIDMLKLYIILFLEKRKPRAPQALIHEEPQRLETNA